MLPRFSFPSRNKPPHRILCPGHAAPALTGGTELPAPRTMASYKRNTS